jgi:hypothetical protein
MFGGYPRGHVSRFTCVYSGSRERCQFRYDDLAALALPMSIGSVQRGQSIERLSLDWDLEERVSVALGRYEVHPRSIGMVRAEEMRTFGGAIQFQRGTEPTDWIIENQTEVELWDCRIVAGDAAIAIGDLRCGDRVEVLASGEIQRAGTSDSSIYDMRRQQVETEYEGHTETIVAELGDLSQQTMMELLSEPALQLGLRDGADRARLIGWAPKPVPGQQIHPDQDRSLGFSVFVVHF